MHRTHDAGTTNHMEGAPAANKLFVPGPTIRYNAGIQYSRLIHRRCASLDLETMHLKKLKYLKTLKKKCVNSAKLSSADAQHLRAGTPCSSVSSMPTNTSDKQIPELVVNKPLQQLHLPVQSPSDEEADREVAAICKAPEYYRVRSHLHCR